MLRYLILLIVLVSCATHSPQSNRSISSTSQNYSNFDNNDLLNLESLEKVKYTESLIKKTYKEVENRSEPFYFIFKEFYFNSRKKIKKLKVILEKTSSERYVPFELTDNEKRQFLEYITTYNNFNFLNQYLKNSLIVNQPSARTKRNLAVLDFIFSNSYSNIKEEYPKRKLSRMQKKLNLKYKYQSIRYLLSKVEKNIQYFLKTNKDLKLATIVANKIKKSSPTRSWSNYRRLKYLPRHYLYQRLKKKLSNLSLPESGEIEGGDRSFEIVMSVQLSLELIDYLLVNI